MKRVLFTLLAAAAVVGCSKVDKSFDEVNIEDSVVAFGSGGISTRTTVDNMWEAGDAVGITSVGFSSDYSNVKYTADSEGATTTFSVGVESEQIKFPNVESERVSFYAYYPYTESATEAVIPVDVAGQCGDVGGVDLLVAKVEDREYGVGLNSASVDFGFTHALAKVVMNITCNDNVTSLEGLSTQIKGIETKGDYDYSGALVADGTLTEVEDLDLTTAVSADFTTATVTAILHPSTYSTPTLVFTVNDREFTVTFATTLTATKSHTFNIGLGYDITGFDAGSKIEEWGDGDYESVTPEGTTIDLNYNSEGDLYEISSTKGFLAFVDLVSGAGSNTSGATLYGDEVYFDFTTANTGINGKVLANIDLKSVGAWSPIGSTASPYTGTFDGGGFAIGYLYINSDQGQQGLFGVAEGATIRNVTLQSVDMTVGDSCGGIVAELYGGTITNCHIASGSITGYADDTYRIGGIVGYASTDEVTITNCSNSGVVKAVSGVGGIVASGGCSSITIANCYNNGSVASAGSRYSAGGIMSTGSSGNITIIGCYSIYVPIGDSFNSDAPIGGILGATGANVDTVTISYCYYHTKNSLIGSNAVNNTTTTNRQEMSDEELKEERLVTLLNNGAYAYNLTSPAISAYAWRSNDDGYPTFDTTTTPTFTADIAYNDGVYEIYNAIGLLAFADLVNEYDLDAQFAPKDAAYFDSSADNTGISGKLMADIDLSEVCGAEIYTNWDPIGSKFSGTTYTGTFDGGGFTISNLYINKNSDYQGLFGKAKGATIRNVTLKDVDMTVGSISGGTVAELQGGTITNCHVVGGTIKEYTDKTDETFGGIVGWTTASDVTITNCSNSASVTASNLIGGIMGVNYISTTISNCYNSGSLIDSTGDSSPYIGGIISSSVAATTITNCYNSGEILANEDEGVGGIMGGVNTENIAVNLNHCYCDSANTLVSSNTRYAPTIDEYSKTMTTTEMQSPDFVSTLNTTASTISGASGWVAGVGTYLYPVLDSTKTPQVDGSVK